MNKKLIGAFSANDEQAVADEITTLIADCLKRENERLRERLALQQRISKRPMIYACGIKELPPHVVQGGALAMLKFTCTALFPIVTEKEFETLPYDEIIGRLKKRIDYGDGLLEAVKAHCAGLKNDIAAVGADAHAGRVAAEHAAHDAAAARGDIADSEERTQFVIHKGFEDMEPVKTGVAILVTKKHNRSRNGKAAQRKAKNDPEIQSAKKRAADDMHRALERVRDDPAVIAGNHGAVLTACRRLCDWKDDAGHVHHGKFEQLTTSKKYGEPQYAPLMDWQGNPIKPETLARNFRDARKAKPKLKRGKK